MVDVSFLCGQACVQVARCWIAEIPRTRPQSHRCQTEVRGIVGQLRLVPQRVGRVREIAVAILVVGMRDHPGIASRWRTGRLRATRQGSGKRPQCRIPAALLGEVAMAEAVIVILELGRGPRARACHGLVPHKHCAAVGSPDGGQNPFAVEGQPRHGIAFQVLNPDVLVRSVEDLQREPPAIGRKTRAAIVARLGYERLGFSTLLQPLQCDQPRAGYTVFVD